MDDKEYCIKHDVKCPCGRQSIVFDTWFNYFPCDKHSHLSPSEYSRVDWTKEKSNET